MPTQEERINTLERNLASLEKRFNDVDIQSVNHNSTMLLGMVYGQTANIKEIKSMLSEHTSDIRDIKSELDEHRLILNEHTALLNQILDRLPK